jgi:fumarate hydratase subunit beta
MKEVTIPISEKAITDLKVGDQVSLSGIILTARDAAHKYLIEQFVDGSPKGAKDRELEKQLKSDLKEGAIYHCGPIVRKTEDGWEFVAAGPTTSIREEPYEGRVIEAFEVRAIIGKGGMGGKTLEACKSFKAVYLHAVGGAASLLAESIKEVVDVYKLDLGVPEAMWKIRVEGFPAIVTMDSHGKSLHAQIEKHSQKKLDEILATVG